jgi:hypothetical protein
VNLASRILGVIRRPRTTFQTLVGNPRWADVLLVTTAAAALAGALVMRTDIGQQALVDQWERTALAFGQPVDDASYAKLEEASTQGPLYAAGMAVVYGPVAALALALLIFLVCGGNRGGATFGQVLSVTAHAGVVLALRQVIAAPATYIRETTASATALGVWFPGFDEASPVARFLGALDLIVLWWAVVLAIGIAVLYRRRTRRVVATVVGAYAGAALLLAIVMAGVGGS